MQKKKKNTEKNEEKTKPEVERSNGQAATSSASPSSISSSPSSSWCLVRSNSTLNCRHFCQSFVCLPRPTNTNWRSFILPHAISLSKASRTMPYQNNSWHDIKAKIKKKKLFREVWGGGKQMRRLCHKFQTPILVATFVSQICWDFPRPHDSFLAMPAGSCHNLGSAYLWLFIYDQQ